MFVTYDILNVNKRCNKVKRKIENQIQFHSSKQQFIKEQTF